MEGRVIRILGIDDVAIFNVIRLERCGPNPQPLPAPSATGKRSQTMNGVGDWSTGLFSWPLSRVSPSG
jgi:hypothetical protein